MEQEIQRMLRHSLLSLPFVFIDMKWQAGDGFSQDTDAGVNRRSLHGRKLIDLFATC